MNNSTGLIAIVFIDEYYSDVMLTPLFGVQLISRAVMLANACSEIVKTYIFTQNEEIIKTLIPVMKINSTCLIDVPFKFENAQVSLEKGVRIVEGKEKENFQYALYINPLAPFLSQENIMEAFQRIILNGESDGIYSCVENKRIGSSSFVEIDGYLKRDRVNKNVNPRRFLELVDIFCLLRLNSSESLGVDINSLNIMPYELTDSAAIRVQTVEEIKSLNFEKPELATLVTIV